MTRRRGVPLSMRSHDVLRGESAAARSARAKRAPRAAAATTASAIKAADRVATRLRGMSDIRAATSGASSSAPTAKLRPSSVALRARSRTARWSRTARRRPARSGSVRSLSSARRPSVRAASSTALRITPLIPQRASSVSRARPCAPRTDCCSCRRRRGRSCRATALAATACPRNSSCASTCSRRHRCLIPASAGFSPSLRWQTRTLIPSR